MPLRGAGELFGVECVGLRAMTGSLAYPDDRVRWETRALAALIVPFLLAAFFILYLRPQDTGALFAWPIAPSMTSFVLASAYLGGAYFFVRVVFERQWHRVAVGFVPVTTFALLMLATTLVHWDRFSHGSAAFDTWVVLYATTPFLVCGAWLRNRHSDPRALGSDDAETPTPVRWIMGGFGALLLAAGLSLFVLPDALVALWPWRLTLLTARVIGACFALTGVFGLVIAQDRRWTAARIALESQAVGVALILVGVLRAWSDFKIGKATTWVFVGGMSTLLVAVAVLYAVLERTRRGIREPHDTPADAWRASGRR